MNLRNLNLKTVKRRKQGIDFNQILNRENVSQIEEIFKCNICYQIMINPYDCELCEQSFCYDCIMNLFENGKLCPGGCEENKLKQTSSGIKAQLQSLNFKCLNSECKEEIQYNKYLNHLKECKFSNVVCPNLGCDKRMIKHLIEDHVNKECQFTVYKCENCDFDFNRESFQEHLETCKLVFDNLKRKYDLKGNENEDSMLIKSSKFMNTVILNLSKVLQTFDSKFDTLHNAIDSINLTIREKNGEVKIDPIPNLNFERRREINFSFNQTNFKESLSPIKDILNQKNLELSITPIQMNEKIAKDLVEFENLENIFSYSKNQPKPDKMQDKLLFSNDNNKISKKENNSPIFNNLINPIQKSKQISSNFPSTYNLDLNNNNIEKKSYNNDSLEFSIKENNFNILNEKIDKLYEMIQIILLTNTANNNNAVNSSHNQNEAIKQHSSTLTNFSNKKEIALKNQINKTNLTTNNHNIGHHHDKKENKNVKKIENKDTIKSNLHHTITNNNNLQNSLSFSKQHNSSSTSLINSSRSKVVDKRRTVISRERSPRICDHKTFSQSHNNENLSNSETVKLINKILEKMKSLENSFNFDDLNNKLQNIGNQLKESITQAFIEIMKFNMNQNKNEEEQNEIEVNNKILTENNFESLLEINKNILEKLDKIHKEKFTINSNSKEEENSNKLNNYLTHNFQNLLNEINLISNLVVDLKKNNQVICKENTNNDLLKVPPSDTNCFKCKILVCENCMIKCDQCESHNCLKCLEKCVCNKVVFCEGCLFDITPILPHDCIKWLNGSHTFSGIKSRSILPLPKNFEIKIYIEKLGSDLYVGLTDNKNFEENSLDVSNQIWGLKVKTGQKYSSGGSLETYLSHGAKEFDSILISLNNGNLNFKINSNESLTAFNIDQNKEYFLYIENDDKNSDCKVSIIYIRNKV